MHRNVFRSVLTCQHHFCIFCLRYLATWIPRVDGHCLYSKHWTHGKENNLVRHEHYIACRKFPNDSWRGQCVSQVEQATSNSGMISCRSSYAILMFTSNSVLFLFLVIWSLSNTSHWISLFISRRLQAKQKHTVFRISSRDKPLLKKKKYRCRSNPMEYVVTHYSRVKWTCA